MQLHKKYDYHTQYGTHLYTHLYHYNKIAAIIKYSVQLIIKLNILLNLCESHVARSPHALITKPKLIISRTV